MKHHITTYLLICCWMLPALHLSAQRYRSGDPNIGRTHSFRNYGADNHLLLREADNLVRSLDFERASLTLDNAVAQSQQSAEALIRRARLKKLLGMTAEAEKDLQLANRLNPYAADLYGYYGPQGVLNLIAFQPERTMQELSTGDRIGVYDHWLLEQYHEENLSGSELEAIERSLSEMAQGNWPAAAAIMEDLLQQKPASATALDLYGLILIEQGQYDKAAATISRAVTLAPDLATAWHHFGVLDRRTGRFAQALSHLNRAITLKPGMSMAYFERALVYKSIGEKEKAVEDYHRIIDMDGPEYLDALLNRGLTRKMLGDFHGAFSDLDQAVRAFPGRADVYKNRGNLYLFFGFPHQAIEDYTQAIRLAPGFAEAYYNRGLANLIRYDPASGCADLKISAEMGFEPAMEKQRFFCVE